MTKRWTVRLLTVLLIVNLTVQLRVPTLSPAQSPLETIYTTQGKRYPHITPSLLKAIAMTETGERPGSVNLKDPSFGLMQVLCVPDIGGQCRNGFPAVDGWEGTTVRDLLDPKVNVQIAAQILEWNIRTYGYLRGIAVYNCWSARKDPVGGEVITSPWICKVVQGRSAPPEWVRGLRES